jgi:hypothetical protein
MSANVCEYCDEDDSKPVTSYDAGNGAAATFHPDCHAEMMREEICGGDACDVGQPHGSHCGCSESGLPCCVCAAVPS